MKKIKKELLNLRWLITTREFINPLYEN
jgi:hypothetical protein